MTASSAPVATDGATNQPTPGSQQGSSPPAGTTLLKDSTMETTQTLTMKVSFPAMDTNKVNAALLFTQLLPLLKATDDKTMILPSEKNKDTHAPLCEVSEIPKNNDISVYTHDIQLDPIKKQTILFITVSTSTSFSDLKYGNRALVPWLKEKKIWLSHHQHSSHYTQAVGVLVNAHPTYCSRHNTHAKIEPGMDGIEFQLRPSQQFYYKDDKRFTTTAIEIIVDAKDEAAARKNLMIIFSNPAKYDLNTDMDFVPRPQNNGFARDAYRTAISGQRKYVTHVRSCPIQGIKNMDKKIFINRKHQSL